MSKSKTKAASKKTTKPAKKAAVKKAAAKKPATPVKKASAKAPVKKVAAKKVPAKKATTKATASKKAAAPVKKAAPAKNVDPKETLAYKKPLSHLNLNAPSPNKNKSIPIQRTMSEQDDRARYSNAELKEFEVIIMEKLDTARKQFQFAKEVLSRKNDEGTDNTTGNLKLLEDGADVLEKESFSAFAARQQKFILQLENAIARIKNGTYGICIVTGKLIPKERLKLVPHTQHSIEAKQQRND